MDKSSPVYENFAKKMDAMSGKPKINRQTIKFGSGMGLEQRVGNNEKKITLLKNIFKAQKIDIGDKIAPTTPPLQTTLEETNEIFNLKRIWEIKSIKNLMNNEIHIHYKKI